MQVFTKPFRVYRDKASMVSPSSEGEKVCGLCEKFNTDACTDSWIGVLRSSQACSYFEWGNHVKEKRHGF